MGIVKTHAVTMLPATPPRTADMRLHAPTPQMHALITWVVDTGLPALVAARIVTVPLVSAAKPTSGVMRMIFVRIVLMMRLPPAIVPKPIAAAHAKITHVGTWPSVIGSDHAGRPV